MQSVLQDVRFGARTLARRPAFTTLAVVTLAVGIGATSAIFSLFEAILVRRLPFREPDRVVFVWERNLPRNRERNVVGPYNFLRWRERARSFEGLAGFQTWPTNITGQGEPERVHVALATGNFFEVFGAGVRLGRPLVPSDSAPDAPAVVVLSDGYWKRTFGADPAAVGRDLIVNGRPATIVGVTHESFRVPAGAQLWVPLPITPELREAPGRWMAVAGRLRPGVTLAQARQEMAALAAALQRENPDFNSGWGASVFPLHADLVREVRPGLRLLMAAAGLLLLLACGNVANLLLARAVAREREMAVRGSLGANAARLVRQLLTESLLLAVMGGLAGLLLGAVMLRVLKAMLPADIPLVTVISLNARVVAISLALAVLSAILFGLAPALTLARPSLAATLRDGGAVRGSGRPRARLKQGLVVAEIAMSLLLAAGAGLMLRSFWRLSTIDPGFRPRDVLTVQVDLPPSRYEQPARQVAFFSAAVERVKGIPGVQSAAAISWMPMGVGSATRFRLHDRPQPPAGAEPVGDVRIVTPGLFRAMGIPLLMGRDFTEADHERSRRVVIVNRAMTDEFWPGEDAIGKRISMSWGGETEGEVVGVVGDVRLTALDTPSRTTLYWPLAQVPNEFMTLMVRSAGPPEALASALRTRVRALDADVPLSPVRPLEAVVQDSLQRQRFVLLLTGAFAGVALLLAAVGTYGVMSYTVLQRVPEMGVRLALGAAPRDIHGLILRHGLALGAAGVATGLLAALAAGRLVASLLYQVSPRDPVALAAVSAVLLLVVLGATYFPARRASKLDPLTALRTD